MDIGLPILKTVSSPAGEDLFLVTEAASEKIRSLLAPNQLLRVSIKGGGCAGLEYLFNLVDKNDLEDGDQFFKDIVVDYLSAPYLAGATLDYKSDIGGAYFSFKNPKASGECGCGKSFAA